MSETEEQKNTILGQQIKDIQESAQGDSGQINDATFDNERYGDLQTDT